MYKRQAEFLVHDFFTWPAVAEVAVMTTAAAQRAQAALDLSLIHI